MAKVGDRVWTARALAFLATLSGDDTAVREAFEGTEELAESDVIAKMEKALR